MHRYHTCSDSDSGCMLFPVLRRCRTGEGYFTFLTSGQDSEQLYQKVHANSQEIARRARVQDAQYELMAFIAHCHFSPSHWQHQLHYSQGTMQIHMSLNDSGRKRQDDLLLYLPCFQRLEHFHIQQNRLLTPLLCLVHGNLILRTNLSVWPTTGVGFVPMDLSLGSIGRFKMPTEQQWMLTIQSNPLTWSSVGMNRETLGLCHHLEGDHLNYYVWKENESTMFEVAYYNVLKN